MNSRNGAAGDVGQPCIRTAAIPARSPSNSLSAALPGRAGAERPRPSGAGHVPRRVRSLRSGKIGAAIPRGEFGPCDPRRPQATTGASVRLTSVAQAHPYSPRHRAQRAYAPRRFSGPRKPVADGQCRRGACTAAGSRSLHARFLPSGKDEELHVATPRKPTASRSFPGRVRKPSRTCPHPAASHAQDNGKTDPLLSLRWHPFCCIT
jgi:hypothetical protein